MYKKREVTVENRILKKIAFLSFLYSLVILSLSGLGIRPDKVTYAMDENNYTRVHVFYDSRETIVLQDDDAVLADNTGTYNGKNYPNAHLVFVVAVTTRPEGKKELFNGKLLYDPKNEDHAIRIKMKLKAEMGKHKFYTFRTTELNLSEIEEALFNADRTAIDWKGLYRALGSGDVNSFKTVLNKITFDPSGDGPEEVEFVLDKNNPYCVIAVPSWNWDFKLEKAFFALENTTVGDELAKAVTINPKTIEMGLKIDNVDIVREKVEAFKKSGNNIADFSGDPGPFVVADTDALSDINERLYNNIIEIKRKIAHGEISGLSDLPSAGGIDWLQVAATDIYNYNIDHEVFKCVWEVEAKQLDYGASGQVIPFKDKIDPPTGQIIKEWIEPWKVYLNAYMREMRFNEAKSDSYGFKHYSERNSVIWHEPEHTYHFLNIYTYKKGTNKEPALYDHDGDFLVVKDNETVNNTQPPYITFTHDHKKRGFALMPDLATSKEPFLSWLIKWCHNGEKDGWGDGAKYPLAVPVSAFFVLKLDSLLSADELNDIFSGKDVARSIETGIPSDFPDTSQIFLMGVGLYKPKKGLFDTEKFIGIRGSDDVSVPLVEAVPVAEPPKTTVYGEYKPQKFSIKVNGCRMKEAGNYGKMLKKTSLNCGLYAIFAVHTPWFGFWEYDADTFSVTRGKGF